VAPDNDPVLALLDAIAAHPLSTREELRAAGVVVDEATLRQAIGRGFVEVHLGSETMVGREESFSLTRFGLVTSGRDPDASPPPNRK
jgi:hypothetical protein